jgi:hypothetical protein
MNPSTYGSPRQGGFVEWHEKGYACSTFNLCKKPAVCVGKDGELAGWFGSGTCQDPPTKKKGGYHPMIAVNSSLADINRRTGGFLKYSTTPNAACGGLNRCLFPLKCMKNGEEQSTIFSGSGTCQYDPNDPYSFRKSGGHHPMIPGRIHHLRMQAAGIRRYLFVNRRHLSPREIHARMAHLHHIERELYSLSRHVM